MRFKLNDPASLANAIKCSQMLDLQPSSWMEDICMWMTANKLKLTDSKSSWYHYLLQPLKYNTKGRTRDTDFNYHCKELGNDNGQWYMHGCNPATTKLWNQHIVSPRINVHTLLLEDALSFQKHVHALIFEHKKYFNKNTCTYIWTWNDLDNKQIIIILT